MNYRTRLRRERIRERRGGGGREEREKKRREIIRERDRGSVCVCV